MRIKLFGRIIVQTIVTTAAVIALVVLLLGFLPDYATFDAEMGNQPQGQRQVYYANSWEKFGLFWDDCFRHDMGASRSQSDHSVGEIIRRDSVVTLGLVGLSITLSTVLGGLLGFLASYWTQQWIRNSIELLGVFLSSIPSFLLVPILIYCFAMKWPLLPVALWQGPESLILPIIALSLRPTFFLARIFSTQLEEAANAEFVLTARAKGLSRRSIWFKHVLPNGLTAFVVGVGNLFGQLISGTFLVESLFALPGLGFLFVRSLTERDYPVFLGLVLLFTLFLQVGQRLADLVLSLVVPAKFNNNERVV